MPAAANRATTAAPAGVVRDEAAPVANAAAELVAAADEPVALAEADVGEAVVAVFATLATEAMEEEAAARRLEEVSILALDCLIMLGDLRLSSSAVLSDLVLHGRLLVAVRAVVVARQDIRVHIAQADPVVAVLLAPLDALLVAADTGVDNVLGCAVGSKGGGSKGNEASEDGYGTHGEVCKGVRVRRALY